MDYAAVMLAGQACDTDMRLLLDVLPAVESAIINPEDPDGGDDGD